MGGPRGINMDFRTAGYGAALAAIAAFALSSSAAVLSTGDIGLFPADFGNPDYLALLVRLIVAVGTALGALAVLRMVFGSVELIRTNSEIDCYRLASPGAEKTGDPPGKMPEERKV